ncbi:hypothetical protein P4S68_16735 [Pseudoalteromonas sp. Hal099]
MHQKKVLGVIVVQQKMARVFSQDEESFFNYPFSAASLATCAC